MKLELLTSHQIEKGMLVVCFEAGTIRVGRVQSEVKKYTLRQALLTGVLAEFDLLYADDHERAGDLVYQKYFYLNKDAPADSGVFKWPDLMKLTFKLAESSLKMGRMGWLVHIEVGSHLGPAIVLE